MHIVGNWSEHFMCYLVEPFAIHLSFIGYCPYYTGEKVGSWEALRGNFQSALNCRANGVGVYLQVSNYEKL